jgi:predicted enzyme related to lactoylglutathione lyase
VKNRLHLDVVTSDIPEAAEQAQALGAERVGGIHRGASAFFQVLFDPEGNEWCLVQHAAATFPGRGPAGVRPPQR